MRYGWNSTAYQILNPGIEHWFSDDTPAVVGYVRRNGYLLAAGAPVCGPEHLADVAAAFERFAGERKLRVCYVCAAERLRSVLPSHSVVAAGAEPVWDPAEWPSILAWRASLRAQLNRARNKNVVVSEVSPPEAAADPEFRRVLDEWLACRGLPPLHFMVEPDVLRGVIEDRVVFAAHRAQTLIAYLVASPAPARSGYLIEELARSRDAPNGTSELLIDAAMRRFAAKGCSYVTMGLVALSGDALNGNPAWIRALMFWARAHANRFYNFQGLEAFRAKMRPTQWETIYFISNEKGFSPSTLYAIGGAFSQISPLRAIAVGVIHGARAEIRRLRQRADKG
jgi:phosphatidylglycerol lysyltransferase